MPRQQTVAEVRLDNILKCVTITVNTLDLLVDTLKIPGLEAMVNTTESLLKMVQTIKQDKNECAELMEQTQVILSAIIGVYIKSDTGIELPPSTLREIANFTQTLHKTHTFVEAQQSGSRVKKFLRQGELSGLLKNCKAGLQQGLVFFQIESFDIMFTAREMEEQAQARHQEVLNIAETLSSSDSASFVSSKVELAGLIEAHLGMKPGKDLTQAVLHRIVEGPPTLLVLDNLETVWEPVQSCKEVEEFLSQLTDIAKLSLMDAARKMFIDTAEDRHSIEEMDQVLQLTDNMPLSISLLAHLVDAEDCSAILLRWQKEHTSVISDGYDQRSNLELSISLSLASPRITSTPHSEELLSLLSILPDGLSDAELKQSDFAIQDILGCKRALLRTALAYNDDRKRLKALVPIREYMAKLLPPTDKMIRPLFKHFRDLLQAYGIDAGKQPAVLYVERLTSNYTDIPNILQNGLHPGHPDLAESIYCASHFIQFSLAIGKNAMPMTDKVINLLPYSEDHRGKVYFTVRLFGLHESRAINQPETLLAQTFEWLKTIEDPDLEGDDIPKALEYCQMGLSLARSHGSIKGQSAGLGRLSWIKWSTGDYITSRTYAQEVQRLANISTTLLQEVEGLYTEAVCCQALGCFPECIFAVKQATALLELCGLPQGQIGHGLMNCQAEVHALKSEYDQACNLHKQLLQTSQKGHLYYEGLSLINIARIEVLMGVPYNIVKEKIDQSHAIFQKSRSKMMITACEMIQADLNLREGDMSCSTFFKCLKCSWGQYSEVVSYCLERLADITCWSPHHDPSWSTVLLAYSFKAKEKLGIHKALQFIGDVHLMENDEVTAVSLFTVALEGFTHMDVHCSRAECMIRLGDIAKKNEDLLKALELWETAKPLFECSSQAKRVQDIDERVGGISEEVKEQHRKNFARLVELNVPAGKVEEVDSDAEELELEQEQVELIDAEACIIVTVKFPEAHEGLEGQKYGKPPIRESHDPSSPVTKPKSPWPGQANISVERNTLRATQRHPFQLPSNHPLDANVCMTPAKWCLRPSTAEYFLEGVQYRVANQSESDVCLSTHASTESKHSTAAIEPNTTSCRSADVKALGLRQLGFSPDEKNWRLQRLIRPSLMPHSVRRSCSGHTSWYPKVGLLRPKGGS
ncbi:hypothetical protein B0H16DRAFT_1857083 [Mycena metata]|uniref:Uncharacterized protein n=1 Tax=Mycena metata TaxID=1033252 RepID=A0AAD7IJY2_9AGAR|nr:hypothetical protein B0H16DRAFT_1857083 [Mycena metata]